MDLMEKTHRPWGYYQVLTDEKDHKVKRIVVNPGFRTSLQRHERRREHWFVLTGTVQVTLDEETLVLESGNSLDVPVQRLHRLHNPGTIPAVLIEVQTGDYFGEDDIERIDDDHGRVSVHSS